MKNHIKRNTTTLKIKTKVNFNNGILPKDTVLIVNHEINCGWFGSYQLRYVKKLIDNKALHYAIPKNIK